MADKQTDIQQLSDLFYGLQVTTKIIEGLLTEHASGARSQQDFESRFHSQVWLLSNNLKGIKPLVEKVISDGFNKYESSVGSSSSEKLFLEGSDRLADSTQLSPEES